MSTLDAPLAATAPVTSPTRSRLASWWHQARALYQFVLPIRFSFIALAVVAFAFLSSDQGHDLIAALVEDDPTAGGASAHPIQRIFFVPLVCLLALQIWYWSRQLLRIRYDDSPAAADFPRLALFLPRILGASAFVIMLFALRRVGVTYGDSVAQPQHTLWILAGGLLVGLIAFVAFTVGRRHYLDRHGHQSIVEQTDDSHQLAKSTRFVLIGSLVLAILFFLAATFAVQETGVIGSISIVLLSLSFWVSLGSVVVYRAMKAKVPILTWLLLFALVISPLADNHVVKDIANTSAGITTRPNVDTTFNTWYERLHRDYPAEGKHPVFVVATEGGGIRAAYWTAAVLTALADDVPAFREHLFAISGVSGGSLGATVFDSLLLRQMENPAALPKLRPAAREILAHDALAPTLAAMTQSDFVQRFVPAPILPDRARALEGGWEEAWRQQVPGDDRFANGFLAMTRGHEDRTPSLFLNGTTVETGSRIIASNLQITQGQGGEFSDSIDLFKSIGADVAVSTAVDNSTRFTYVGPAGTLRRNPAGNVAGSKVDCKPGARCEHVIDGGYFENSGAVTASEIVNILRRGKYGANVQPYILVIRYGAEFPKGPDPEMTANELLSPIRGLLNTRDARAVLAVDQIHSMTGAPTITFTLVQHPHTIVFPLGWLLSYRTRSLIDAQMGIDSKENGPAMQEVAALLRKPALGDAVQERAITADPVARATAR
jgi:hypothetical protein